MRWNKRFIVYAGNYGNGKTELSLNTALALAQKGKTALVDVDVVNPYFRSSESGDMLQEAGVTLIKPPFANTAVDVPAISAEVFGAFEYEYAVFDAGGDPVGATVLGRLHEGFEKVRDDLVFYYVVNARRPFQERVDDAVEMMAQIEANARMDIDGIVNNANLAAQTSPDDLKAGQELCRQITERTGVPLAFASAKSNVLDAFVASGYDGQTFAIDIYTRPSWLDT